MHFIHSIWKNLHLTEIFYTDMSVVFVTNMRYAAATGFLFLYLFLFNTFWNVFVSAEIYMDVYKNMFVCAKRIFCKVCVTGTTIPAEKLRKFNMTAEQYRNAT